MLERTPAGKVVLYRRSTGERLERWPIDAKDMLRSGDYVISPGDVAQAPLETGHTGNGQVTQSTDAAVSQETPVDKGVDTGVDESVDRTGDKTVDTLKVPIEPESDPTKIETPEYAPGVPLITQQQAEAMLVPAKRRGK